jgi:cytochrome P450
MSSVTTNRKVPAFPTEKHWLFGSAYLLKDHPMKTLTRFHAKYGDIFSLSLPFNKVVVAAKPEFAKYVLLENNKNYTKSLAYEMLAVLLGNGLLTSEGEFWKKQRKLIQPAFHKQKLAALTAMMVARTEEAVDRFKAYSENGGDVDMLPEMTDLTLDIISKSIFSSGLSREKAMQVGEHITRLNEYAVEKLNNPIRLPAKFPTPFNIRERKSMQALDDVIYAIIEARRKEGVSKDDLLSILLDAKEEETGEGMDNKQLRDEVMTIFIAGNETSSNALSWMFYLLSQNPEAEQKMMAEINEKLDAGTELTFENLMQFNYVRMVIEESMRLYPPAWSVGRRNIEDDEIGGYHIEKGTNVLVPLFLFHRSAKYWDEPMAFRPERFAPDKRNNIDRFVYMPFGGGPRLCIGNHFAMLEMQIILILLYRHFKFELQPGFVAEEDPLITLRPKNGMKMKVSKRA